MARLPDSSSFPIKTGQLFIGLAVVMAIVSAFMIQRLTGDKKVAPEVKVPLKDIVVASAVIPPGTTLSSSDLQVVKWPEQYLPPGSYFDEGRERELIGRLVRVPLLPGEPIYREKLAGDRSHGGLPAMIPVGYRAVTLSVSEVKGVAGFIKPGDMVDVMATVEEDAAPDSASSGGKTKRTVTVLQNVMVLASAQEMSEEVDVTPQTPPGLEEDKLAAEVDKKAPKKKKSDQELEKERKQREKERREAEKRAKTVSSITVAVRLEDAQKLALAEDSGDLRLVLRAEGDAEVASVSSVDQAQLFGASLSELPPPNLAPPVTPDLAAPSGEIAKRGRAIEFIEGTEKSSQDF